jgi:predicted metal-dependent phosphoesterase TrpH
MIAEGIIHVHSNFSYDGRHSLREITLFAKDRGYSFVGMSDHSDTYDRDKMTDLVKECKSLSDSNFLLIPGIEFTCENNLHLLGLGIEQLTELKEPISVSKFIKAQGGVAVVSHPIRYNYRIPAGLEMAIDGIEIWNAGYDGRFIPNDLSIDLWQSLRKNNPSLHAFGGQDLHHFQHYCHVKITLACDELSREKILAALKEGAFSISNPYFRFYPSGMDWLTRKSIIWARQAYLKTKAIRDCFAE